MIMDDINISKIVFQILYSKGSCQIYPEGGGVHKKGGGEIIFLKNGGSVDEHGKLWGE